MYSMALVATRLQDTAKKKEMTDSVGTVLFFPGYSFYHFSCFTYLQHLATEVHFLDLKISNILSLFHPNLL